MARLGAVLGATRAKIEIEQHFQRYDSYEKIIDGRDELIRNGFQMRNVYKLLIYAALKTKNKNLLNSFIDKKLSSPAVRIGCSEFLKPGKDVNEQDFLARLKSLNQVSDFEGMENEIQSILK